MKKIKKETVLKLAAAKGQLPAKLKLKVGKKTSQKPGRAKKSMDHGVVLDYSKITDYIYLGSNFCCQTRFIPELQQKGIVADISLEAERLDQPAGVKYFLWLPTKDQEPIDPKQLVIGAAFIKDLVNHKLKIYVHCKYGHGRSAMLVAAYFIAYGGLSLTEALAFLQKKRPEMHLNAKQLKALRHFAGHAMCLSC